MNNWVNAVILVSYDSSKDSDGILEETENKSKPIPANFKSVTRAEEEHSKVMGYNASLVVELMKCNYNNQSVLIDYDTDKKYAIERVFEKTSELLELTCSDVSKKNG